ncbi:MAG TPA: HlyD family efflux transporter periplasmic adaptor subunit [Thermoanaerobaculia bacterium]|nr:HlyD family efflux transporter periplasmic adaptor subunit [Thermoanaerobaculia bacterium]
MDIVRNPEKKNTRRILWIGGAILAVVLTTVAFGRLKPAAPPVDEKTLVIETVERGPLTRAVRGSGVLTPENVRWIAAATEGRVERVVVQPGTRVTADSVILELSDPQLQQSTRDAEWQLRAAESAYAAAKAELESDRLDREAAASNLRAEARQARLRAKADAELAKAGLAASITKELSESSANALEERVKFEEQRLGILVSSQRSRLAALQAEVEQRRAMLDLQQQRVASLQVRSGIDGILQQVAVQPGQRVNAGTTLARVAQPERLKAEIRVAETQAKDLAVGQRAQLDTRTGVVAAHVARIDPAASNGTVLVDLTIDGPLPAGARPDLSVDATIELERLPDVIHLARPVRAQENASGTVFRVRGDRAERVKVDFGRASATSIEVRSGLAPGDRVIVSDDSSYDKYDEIKIQ